MAHIALFVLNGMASIGMTLINKSIATGFSFPFFVLFVQNFCATLCSSCLVIFRPSTCRVPICGHLPFVIVSTLLFILAIWLALIAFETVSVPMYSVASNLRPLCTCIIECTVNRRKPYGYRLFGLSLIACGAAIAADGLANTAWKGYMIAVTYTMIVSFVAVFDKWMIRKFQKEQTALGLNFCRLVISLPVLFYLSCRYEPNLELSSITKSTWFLVFGSGSICMFAGAIFFMLSEVSSATSIQVANVCYKIGATFISIFLHGEYPTATGWIGYVCSTLGCIVYFFGNY